MFFFVFFWESRPKLFNTLLVVCDLFHMYFVCDLFVMFFSGSLFVDMVKPSENTFHYQTL